MAGGCRFDHRDQPDVALRRCINGDGPGFLAVRVKAEENCFPMIPAGCGHHEELLGNDRPQREPTAV